MPDVSTQSRPDYMGVTRIASEIGQVACGDGTAADGYGCWGKFIRRSGTLTEPIVFLVLGRIGPRLTPLQFAPL